MSARQERGSSMAGRLLVGWLGVLILVIPLIAHAQISRHCADSSPACPQIQMSGLAVAHADKPAQDHCARICWDCGLIGPAIAAPATRDGKYTQGSLQLDRATDNERAQDAVAGQPFRPPRG